MAADDVRLQDLQSHEAENHSKIRRNQINGGRARSADGGSLVDTEAGISLLCRKNQGTY